MKIIANQNGFTYILALTIVMIMGIMLGMVGQSWKTIKQREQEKELLFRGSQIKEAIENWKNPKYIPGGGVSNKAVKPLRDLKDLLGGDQQASKKPYLPQHYASTISAKSQKCAPDCAELKIYQDPMTGKEWRIIRGSVDAQGKATPNSSGEIIGVASNSDETPFRTDFKDTALENMAAIVTQDPLKLRSVFSTVTTTKRPGVGDKITKYSQWEFIAEIPSKNDHSKIYRAYHESW